MANLILTDSCKRNCSYCFAKDANSGEFTLEAFKTAVAFIQTGPPMANLLGGEPTDHPLITTFIEHLMDNHVVTRIFTNGMAFRDRQRNIKNIIERMTNKHGKLDLMFNVNVNNPKDQTKVESELQSLFFSNFKNITYLGHTIYDENEDLSYLLNIILNNGLDPTIRLGLALPICRAENNFLPREKYEVAAENVFNFVMKAKKLNIKVHFDCGFPLCMFSFQEVTELMDGNDGNIAFVCGQPLDIYPNLEVTNCFPLSKLYKISITDFNNIKELYEHLEDEFMTPEGSYTDKCTQCFYFGYACSGGCKAFYMNDLRERRLQNATN